MVRTYYYFTFICTITIFIATAQLVELKNGETYNGHLVSCDNWMNINLREVICTSKVSLGLGLLVENIILLKLYHNIHNIVLKTIIESTLHLFLFSLIISLQFI